MKKNKVLKYVSFLILGLVLLTWILPGTVFQNGKFEVLGRNQIGLNYFGANITVMLQYFSLFSIYLLMIGAFYGVLFKTGGYLKLQEKVAKLFKGKEWVYLLLVILLFGLITSITGINLGLVFLFPAVITTILLLGYDRLTAIFATVGSIGVGMLGSTLGERNVIGVSSILNTKLGDNMPIKVGFLIVGLLLLALFVIKEGNDKLNANVDKKEIVLPKNRDKGNYTWPIVVIMFLLTATFMLAHIDWQQTFKVDAFAKMVTKIPEVKIGEFPIFAKLLGKVVPFGQWSYPQLISVLFIATLIVQIIYRIKTKEYIEGFTNGIKTAVKPALVSFALSFITLIVVDRSLLFTVIRPILQMSKKFNVLTTSFAGLISQLMLPDTFYGTYTFLPYFSGVKNVKAIALLWQALQGLGVIILPTSILLATTLTYLETSYKNYFKRIWKFATIMFIIILIVCAII